ncbi:hypothetical protein, partial [Mesorhizobium sp. Primo-A]|uniref:hypothetical protein n=1 Tax=Mesorhizobium sp. Primo-A TaxID=2496780 RepID=UPI0019D28507
MPSDLAEIAHVERLAADRTGHEIVALVGRLAAVLRAGNRRSTVGERRPYPQTFNSSKMVPNHFN